MICEENLTLARQSKTSETVDAQPKRMSSNATNTEEKDHVVKPRRNKTHTRKPDTQQTDQQKSQKQKPISP